MIMKSVFIFVVFFVTPEGAPGTFSRITETVLECQAYMQQIAAMSEQTGMPSATTCIKSPEFRSNEHSAGRDDRINDTADLIKRLHRND